ncbi:MAG: acylase [Myxococcota bacterium]
MPPPPDAPARPCAPVPPARGAGAWVALALGCAIAGGAWLLAPERAHFDPAPLLAAAERYDVRILRDDYGVPHVYGRTDADVAYGLAYAHSEDDFATIQEVLLTARGRLASVKGASAAPLDYVVRWMGGRAAVDARYEADLSPAARAIAEAYADGVNHYAALHPREVWPGVVPATGRDVAAGFAARMPLFYGLQSTIAEIFGDARRRETAADPFAPPGPEAPVEAALRLVTGGGLLGSNAVAVGPRRSADGATRLLVNSHQPYVGQVSWYEVHLHSEEGWDMAGGVFPGSPVVLHGHNRRLGWASTVNRPDLADVYVLALDEDGSHYRLDGEWRPLEREETVLDVKLLGRLHWPVRREIVRSVHGPVSITSHGAYALRFVGMGEVRQLEQYYRMNRAGSYDEWRDAMRMGAIPSLNFVYADAEGRIAYLYNAQSPVRAPGWDWQAYLPGDRSDLVWTETRGIDEAPQVVDPRSGFVVSANHTPFRSSGLGDDPRPEDFAPESGFETRMTNRALRALELYGQDRWITRDEFREYKYDKRYSEDARVRDVVAEVLAADYGDDAVLRDAQERLASWGFSVELDDRAAALGVLTALPTLVAEMKGEADVPRAVDTFPRVVERLRDRYGRVDPTWGEVNRFRRGTLDLPANGGPDVLRALEDFSPDDDGVLVPNTGDSFIMFVEWDRDGEVSSESVHQYGSATLDASSPHYDDQVELFLAEGTKPVYLDESALRAHLEREYRPGEELAGRTGGTR